MWNKLFFSISLFSVLFLSGFSANIRSNRDAASSTGDLSSENLVSGSSISGIECDFIGQWILEEIGSVYLDVSSRNHLIMPEGFIFGSKVRNELTQEQYIALQIDGNQNCVLTEDQDFNGRLRINKLYSFIMERDDIESDDKETEISFEKFRKMNEMNIPLISSFDSFERSFIRIMKKSELLEIQQTNTLLLLDDDKNLVMRFISFNSQIHGSVNTQIQTTTTTTTSNQEGNTVLSSQAENGEWRQNSKDLKRRRRLASYPNVPGDSPIGGPIIGGPIVGGSSSVLTSGDLIDKEFLMNQNSYLENSMPKDFFEGRNAVPISLTPSKLVFTSNLNSISLTAKVVNTQTFEIEFTKDNLNPKLYKVVNNYPAPGTKIQGSEDEMFAERKISDFMHRIQSWEITGTEEEPTLIFSSKSAIGINQILSFSVKSKPIIPMPLINLVASPDSYKDFNNLNLKLFEVDVTPYPIPMTWQQNILQSSEGTIVYDVTVSPANKYEYQIVVLTNGNIASSRNFNSIRREQRLTFQESEVENKIIAIMRDLNKIDIQNFSIKFSSPSSEISFQVIPSYRRRLDGTEAFIPINKEYVADKLTLGQNEHKFVGPVTSEIVQFSEGSAGFLVKVVNNLRIQMDVAVSEIMTAIFPVPKQYKVSQVYPIVSTRMAGSPEMMDLEIKISEFFKNATMVEFLSYTDILTGEISPAATVRVYSNISNIDSNMCFIDFKAPDNKSSVTEQDAAQEGVIPPSFYLPQVHDMQAGLPPFIHLNTPMHATDVFVEGLEPMHLKPTDRNIDMQIVTFDSLSAHFSLKVVNQMNVRVDIVTENLGSPRVYNVTKVYGIASTMMAGPPDAMEIEMRVSQFFDKLTKFEFSENGDTIMFHSDAPVNSKLQFAVNTQIIQQRRLQEESVVSSMIPINEPFISKELIVMGQPQQLYTNGKPIQLTFTSIETTNETTGESNAAVLLKIINNINFKLIRKPNGNYFNVESFPGPSTEMAGPPDLMALENEISRFFSRVYKLEILEISNASKLQFSSEIDGKGFSQMVFEKESNVVHLPVGVPLLLDEQSYKIDSVPVLLSLGNGEIVPVVIEAKEIKRKDDQIWNVGFVGKVANSMSFDMDVKETGVPLVYEVVGSFSGMRTRMMGTPAQMHAEEELIGFLGRATELKVSEDQKSITFKSLSPNQKVLELSFGQVQVVRHLDVDGASYRTEGSDAPKNLFERDPSAVQMVVTHFPATESTASPIYDIRVSPINTYEFTVSVDADNNAKAEFVGLTSAEKRLTYVESELENRVVSVIRDVASVDVNDVGVTFVSPTAALTFKYVD